MTLWCHTDLSRHCSLSLFLTFLFKFVIQKAAFGIQHWHSKLHNMLTHPSHSCWHCTLSLQWEWWSFGLNMSVFHLAHRVLLFQTHYILSNYSRSLVYGATSQGLCIWWCTWSNCSYPRSSSKNTLRVFKNNISYSLPHIATALGTVEEVNHICHL